MSVSIQTNSIVNEYPYSLRKILEYTQENYTKPISVEDLSRIGSCSRATMFRLFEKYLSTTPNSYLSKRKVELAKRLLLESDLPIHMISCELGYVDPFYFSKVFKKFVGISPRVYRKSCLAN